MAAAFAYSKLQTPQYQSTALVQITGTAGSTTSSGGTASGVTLPDPVQELGSTAVQLEAAKLLGNPNVSQISSEVTGTVDPTTGALSITATGSTPAGSQATARAYSKAFADQIQVGVQAEIDKITANLTALNAKIAGLQAQQAISPSAVTAAEISALTQTSGTLLSQQYTISSGEPYATIQVAAGLPEAPTGLTKSKILIIGFIAGLLVGVGIALIREQLDNRLRTSPDMESITTAPILAELPQDSEVRSGKITISLVQAPQSVLSESIRELRTSLRVIFENTSCPLVAVTSPEAGDGKTFVAANLATAWAMSGSKVIVVSADFRRPRLEEVFGLQATGLPGFADLIRANWKLPEFDDRPNAPRETAHAGATPGYRPGAFSIRGAPSRGRREENEISEDASVKSLLVDSGIWGLKVLPAGTQLDSPSELFGSPGIQPVLDQLPLLADVVIFDTPPVLAVPDTAILGRMADGTVVVASEGKTDRGDLERTIHRLETTQSRVLGVALNRVRRSSTDTYQSYAYKQ